MYINEAPVGSRIHLKVIVKGSTFEFDTNIIDSKNKALSNYCFRNHGVVIQPLKSKGALLKFPDSVKIEAVVYCDDKPQPYLYLQSNIINMVMKDNCVYQVLCCKLNMKEWNRRESYRQYVGLSGIARIGSNKQTCNCIIKNISATGIGLVVNDLGEFNHSEMCRVSFNDVNLHRQMCVNFFLCNVTELEDGKLLLGCKLLGDTTTVANYVYAKQHEELERNYINRKKNYKQWNN